MATKSCAWCGKVMRESKVCTVCGKSYHVGCIDKHKCAAQEVFICKCSCHARTKSNRPCFNCANTHNFPKASPMAEKVVASTGESVPAAETPLTELCSCTTPHAAHTFGGRPMQLCKGIPTPDCDGKVTMASGQCLMCKAYHDSPEPEFKQCPLCKRENTVVTWMKRGGKCPNCGDLFEKESVSASTGGAAGQEALADSEIENMLRQWHRMEGDPYYPSDPKILRLLLEVKTSRASRSTPAAQTDVGVKAREQFREAAREYLKEWSERYQRHGELANMSWTGSAAEYHLINFAARQLRSLSATGETPRKEYSCHCGNPQRAVMVLLCSDCLLPVSNKSWIHKEVMPNESGLEQSSRTSDIAGDDPSRKDTERDR